MDLRLKTQEKTEAVARSIDAEVLQKFHKRPGIEADWKLFLIEIRRSYRKLEQILRREIQCLGGGSQPSQSGSPMDTSLWRKRAGRVETRFRSIFDSAEGGFSALPLSALQRRAVPARSGPKAAKCPTCPKKNQPQKKVVPRSEVQPKPKPAVKPRQPVKTPQPRNPSPAKKVTPRPAVSEVTISPNDVLLIKLLKTRPRRVPGKSEPPKRATPRVKPRVVPKPTRKPRGKPRTRRRR